jgi:hypothetical protein
MRFFLHSSTIDPFHIASAVCAFKVMLRGRHALAPEAGAGQYYSLFRSQHYRPVHLGEAFIF